MNGRATFFEAGEEALAMYTATTAGNYIEGLQIGAGALGLDPNAPDLSSLVLG
jgi:hypothetical protein